MKKILLFILAPAFALVPPAAMGMGTPAGIASAIQPAHLPLVPHFSNLPLVPVIADVPVWLNVVAVVIAIVGGGIGIIYALTGKAQRVEVSPQPVRVIIDEELHKEFVSRDNFDELRIRVTALETHLHREISRVINDGQGRKDEIMRKLSEDAGRVHARIDRIAEEMPQRIITLLRDTGVIKHL